MGDCEKKFNLPDEILSKPKEKELVPYEKSLELAKKLFEKYESQIRDNMYEDIDGWGNVYTENQRSIRHFLEKIPDDVLKHYQGHGITRNSKVEQLAGALSVMANKSIKGWYGPLGGETGGYGAYKTAELLAISKFDKGLPVTQEVNSRQEQVFNEIGWKADIGAFVVDTRYYPMIEELKAMFPDVNIIKANELTEYFKVKSKI